MSTYTCTHKTQRPVNNRREREMEHLCVCHCPVQDTPLPKLSIPFCYWPSIVIAQKEKRGANSTERDTIKHERRRVSILSYFQCVSLCLLFAPSMGGGSSSTVHLRDIEEERVWWCWTLTILLLISWKWISQTLSTTSSLSNVTKAKPVFFLNKEINKEIFKYISRPPSSMANIFNSKLEKKIKSKQFASSLMTQNIISSGGGKKVFRPTQTPPISLVVWSAWDTSRGGPR